MHTKYRASLDDLSRVLTTAVVALFLFLAFNGIMRIFSDDTHPGSVLTQISLVLLLIALLAGGWMLSVRSYTITGDALVIDRVAGRIVIPFAEISAVAIIPDHEMTATIRTFGNGGLFGYYGRFFSVATGHSTWYATQRRNYVLVTASGGKRYVITPDDTKLAGEIAARLTPQE